MGFISESLKVALEGCLPLSEVSVKLIHLKLYCSIIQKKAYIANIGFELCWRQIICDNAGLRSIKCVEPGFHIG